MYKLITFVSIAMVLCSCNPNEIKHRPQQPVQQLSILNVPENNSDKTTQKMTFHDFKMRSIDGEEVSLSQFKGKKVVVLNVASECGFTPQYAKWEAFYKDNKEKVVVLGFPCNQFGGQEPGTATEIKSFCQKNYGVTFPIFEKIDVKGASKSPLYAWLSDKTQNGWCDKEPTWNFCKYLINENGELVEFFASAIEPTNAEFQKAVNKP